MAPHPEDAELLDLLAVLLGASKGANFEGLPPCQEKRFDALLKENNHLRIVFSCPSLSLVHKDHLKFNHENPSEAEQSAFELLSRLMSFEEDAGQALGGKISELAGVLLTNVSESFALLVDSRIRAHASFLAKHGRMAAKKSLSDDLLDRKLKTLLDLGNRVSAASVETKVVVLNMSLDENLEEPSSSVLFQVEMKLYMDSLDGGLKNGFTVGFQALGSLSVLRHDKHLKMNLDVNIKDILADMKQQASEVVAQVVSLTNSFFVIPEPTFRRGDSYLVMPPPSLPLARGGGSLLMKSNSAVISPEISSRLQVGLTNEMPQLMLNEDDCESDTDASELSPDQCEDILDDVFGGMDLTMFSGASDSSICRPSKKAKITK